MRRVWPRGIIERPVAAPVPGGSGWPGGPFKRTGKRGKKTPNARDLRIDRRPIASNVARGECRLDGMRSQAWRPFVVGAVLAAAASAAFISVLVFHP